MNRVSERGLTTAEAAAVRGNDRLRVAIKVDPEIPVPPKHYGGIERIVDMLIRGLMERGHEVTLFANPASVVPCRILPYPRLGSLAAADTFRNMWFTSSGILRWRPHVVHSFARLAYVMPLLPSGIPKIMSYQRIITERSVVWADRLARRGTLLFTGCSAHLIQKFEHRKNWQVVYNGVPSRAYRMRTAVDGDAPLMFLGRVEEIKGPHLAIEAARRANRRLILAGNIPVGHESFFESQVKPFVDGDRIRYAGPVDDSQKSRLLSQSAALLMPILWDEPFGIVMAEALACGTPVIGFKRGSVPEIVHHGVNGFVCDSVEEMAAAVGMLSRIDRQTCRRIMEEHFSDDSVVSSFERIYRQASSRQADGS